MRLDQCSFARNTSRSSGTIKAFHERKKQKQMEFAEKNRIRQERDVQRRKELRMTDRESGRRLELTKESRKERSKRARTSDVAKQRYEAYQEEQRQKKQETDDQIAKTEENSQKVIEERRRTALIKSIQAHLKQDEREANAKHKENLRERKIGEMRQRQEEDDERVRRQKVEKQRIQQMRLVTLKRLEKEKTTFQLQFEESLRTDDNSPLERLAKMYDVDLDEMRARWKFLQELI